MKVGVQQRQCREENGTVGQGELRKCSLCPRACGANRDAGQVGRCHAGGALRVARAALHMWEEPCLSGLEGSGAVFFSGCSLGCIFCQNSRISQEASGLEISTERLAEIFLELQEQGANNINLVTAAQYTLQVRDALLEAKKAGLGIPVVYNSSGYEQVKTLQMLEGLVDIYLPDLKYLSEDLAERYSHAADYPEYAKAAIDEMVRQQPIPEFDARGMMQRGVIVRHLLLPGHVREAKKVIQYLYDTYGDSVYISMMNQYTPVHSNFADPLLNRRVTKREYERLLDFASELGVTNGFYQEGATASESFIPAFDYQGVRKAAEPAAQSIAALSEKSKTEGKEQER